MTIIDGWSILHYSSLHHKRANHYRKKINEREKLFPPGKAYCEQGQIMKLLSILLKQYTIPITYTLILTGGMLIMD